jgi:hypothetical protein
VKAAVPTLKSTKLNLAAPLILTIDVGQPFIQELQGQFLRS